MLKLVKDHFNIIASSYDQYKEKNNYYYERLKILLKAYIPSGKRVLEIGCGTGDLLCEVKPIYGIGIDISAQMITRARAKHKDKSLTFLTSDILHFATKDYFDFIIMIDIVEHLDNVEKSIAVLSRLMNKKTTLLISMANLNWEWILLIAEKLKLKMPEGPHCRISGEKLTIICRKYGLLVIESGKTLLFPIYIPVISMIINKYLERYFNKWAFIQYYVVKKD